MGVADYEITVAGELPPELAAVFAPFVVDSAHATSTIHAQRIDDAALLAMLVRLGDLALTLLRVERLGQAGGLPSSDEPGEHPGGVGRT